MDLNIILWLGGMLFSLGIFAVKFSLGLGFGSMRWKGIFLMLSIYILLFVLIAMLSEQLIKLLEPILRKGSYLPALMAAGMIAWGVILIRRQSDRATEQERSSRLKTQNLNSSLVSRHSLLLLLISCLLCLSAMTFSTWLALSVIKLSPVLVGLGLGMTSVLLSLILIAFARPNKSEMLQIRLGLSMIVIGLYFIASLFLPAKIEEAKGIYGSFLREGDNIIDLNSSIGVFALLFAALIVGYLMNKNSEVKK